MPFEDIELPVPVGYDALLRTQYGDYMVEVQAPSDHSKFTFIYDTEKPYTYYTNQKEQ
jgi:lipopolysaccharide cholinephosphotransferase